MKTAFLLIVLSGGWLFGQTFTTQQILNSGPNSNRINFAVLGDGYTAAQQTAFITQAQNTSNYLFSQSPFSQYKNYFNVYAVKIVSPESGAKHPGTATDVTEPYFPVANPNNYLESTFDVNVHRCLYSYNTNKAAQVLATAVPDYDNAYVLVNSPEYGGCAGAVFSYISTHVLANQIVVHELGHSFGNLADEYWFAPTGETANKTQNSNPSTIKWKNWLNTNSVGIYPFVESPTWFRPHEDCKMRYSASDFCSVCKEQIIERIHTFVSPIDSYTPANGATLSSQSMMNFSVVTVLPIPNTLKYTWKLNGTTLASTANTLALNGNLLVTGTNTLTFTVTDESTMVRKDNHSAIHYKILTWTINKATLCVSTVTTNEKGFSVYPIPARDKIIVKGKQDFKNEISASAIDASGKLIPLESEKEESNVIIVNTESLTKGTYIIQVQDGKENVLTRKIVKE